MEDTSRRRFLVGSLQSVLALGAARLAGAASRAAATDRWLARTHRATVALKDGRLTPRAWRRDVQRATRGVPLRDVLGVLDLDAAAIAIDSLEATEPQHILTLPVPPGLDGLAFTAILARLDAGRAVVPHGHRDMVSMHLILDGIVRVRQYDRVRDEPGHLLVRPWPERRCVAGDTTAVSLDRGNVHWFRPVTNGFALIVAAYDLRPGGEAAARDFVDPLNAEPRADGALRMPRLTAEEAERRYLRA